MFIQKPSYPTRELGTNRLTIRQHHDRNPACRALTANYGLTNFDRNVDRTDKTVPRTKKLQAAYFAGITKAASGIVKPNEKKCE
ncbi:unnamed protein product [Acanthoscelides obtectus]|uniref:Uncharacterized protein n=1 Tax=Acanthoscelides obtectus TaxID=200917 RepID=A0A9P0PU57_ACAOB|nr:unnamed protein product [Acanthoscelides obtectus]CAK1631026.1 hypothetical protein AOBTE_LOCUS6713 [Acanthoscelides obtectus]